MKPAGTLRITLSGSPAWNTKFLEESLAGRISLKTGLKTCLVCLSGFNKLCQSVRLSVIWKNWRSLKALRDFPQENLLGAFRILPRETLSILGNLPRANFFYTTLRVDPHFAAEFLKNTGNTILVLFNHYHPYLCMNMTNTFVGIGR